MCEFAGRRIGLNLSPYLGRVAESESNQNLSEAAAGRSKCAQGGRWAGSLVGRPGQGAQRGFGYRTLPQDGGAKNVFSVAAARVKTAAAALRRARATVLSLSAGLCCWRCFTAHALGA